MTRSVFISVANLDLDRATRRVELWGDGSLLEVRELPLEAQSRADVIIDDIPRTVGAVEVRLVGADPDAEGAPDQLAVDDRAWAVIPPDRTRLILVVGEGDPYLETALSYLPNVELFGVEPDEYGPASERTDGRPWDLVIFSANLPARLPDAPILAIAPPRTSELGQVTGTLRNPGIGSLDLDEPVLRYVDLSTTHISAASQLVLPEWARPIIPGPRGAPLLYAGDRAGLPTAVLAFEPRRSDLPLQVAFPILIANLTGELLGGSTAPTEAVAPGTPVELTIPAGASAITVTTPAGVTTELVRPVDESATVTFADTGMTGIYMVTPIAAPAPSADPSATPTRDAAAVRIAVGRGLGRTAAGRSAGAVAVRRRPVRRRRIDDLPGVGRGDRGARHGRVTRPVAPGGGEVVERPTTRDELWVPIVLLVLIGLCAEWVLYHRDGLIRIRRSLAERMGRDSGAAA